MHQRWHDAPTPAGMRGAILALAVLFFAVSPSLDGRSAKSPAPQPHAQSERQHISIVYYAGSGGGQLTNCKGLFRFAPWTFPAPTGEGYGIWIAPRRDGAKTKIETIWLENEECEIPTHPVNTWTRYDFEAWGYLISEHEVRSAVVYCEDCDVMLIPQGDS